MELLKTIKDEDFGFQRKEVPLILREAVRAIVLNEKNEMAVLYVRKNNFYKVPGGGVEAGENLEEALCREVLEEAGCEIEILKELGEIIEYRTQFDQIQKSYCYLARVVGEIGEPDFTEGEKEDGFERLWINQDRAIELIKEVATDDYFGKFVTDRELTIIQEAKKHI